MTDNQPLGSSALPLIVAGIAVLMGLLLIAIAAWALLGSGFGASPEPARPTPTRIPVSTVSVATASAIPTITLDPTVTPTEATPSDEATAAPTPTTPPAATNPPAPTNPPPPSSTPIPQTTATPATGRVSNAAFSVENPIVGVNQSIWFNFSVTNPSISEPIPFGFLGAATMSTAGQSLSFQPSWTGSELLPGQTLNWRDHTAIGTPGTYLLQLSICYSSVEGCNGGNGWELLAQPVTVTVQ